MWEGSQSCAVLGPSRQGEEVARRARPAPASPALLPFDARRAPVGPRAQTLGAPGEERQSERVGGSERRAAEGPR